MNDKQYKEISIKEFTKAASVYETDQAGVYKMCKKDYPDVLAELEKEPFESLLDCGCGTAPMISLLYEKYPDKHYTGIDLTPKMIEVAKAKNIPGAEFVVGDCENLPFEDNSFDAVICCESFHHYPNVQDFFNSVYRVLKPGGRLILRDMTMNGKARLVSFMFGGYALVVLVFALIAKLTGEYGILGSVESLLEMTFFIPAYIYWRKEEKK